MHVFRRCCLLGFLSNFKLKAWWSKFLIMKIISKCVQERDLNLQNAWIFWRWKNIAWFLSGRLQCPIQETGRIPGILEEAPHFDLDNSAYSHLFLYLLTYFPKTSAALPKLVLRMKKVVNLEHYCMSLLHSQQENAYLLITRLPTLIQFYSDLFLTILDLPLNVSQ